MRILIFLIASIIFTHGSCQPADQIVEGYNLSKPVQMLKMPKRLKEISGLTYWNGHVYAVQDEKGNLYRIDSENEQTEKIDFAKDGDYESVEVVDSFFLAMTSKGACYKIVLIQDSAVTSKVERFTKKNQNLEGMALDPFTDHVLIASKGSPEDTTKTILSLRLSDMKLEEDPYYILDQEKLKTMAKDPVLGRYSFNPSALAVHPFTGNLFILSHPNQQLLVLGKDKAIRSLTPLNTQRFVQPEGICFAPDGTLYISTEGKKVGPGKIFIFEPIADSAPVNE